MCFPKEYGNINACTWANCIRSHKNSKPPITGEERRLKASSYMYEKHLERTLDFSFYNMGKEIFYSMVLPSLKRYHLEKVKAIDLSYNNLDNECINELLKFLPIPDKKKGIVGLEALNLSGNPLNDIFNI